LGCPSQRKAILSTPRASTRRWLTRCKADCPLQHIKKEDLWEKVKTVTGKAMYVRWQALKRHMQNHMGHVWKVFWRYYDQGENPL
jgi:hypothetical protein